MDFLARAQGVYSVFILEDVASDKRLDDFSVISSGGAFEDCSAKA